MLTGKHAVDDARILDDLARGVDGDSTEVKLLRAVVKGLSLTVKLLVTMRTNQVMLMKKQGVELRKPEDRDRDRKPSNEATK